MPTDAADGQDTEGRTAPAGGSCPLGHRDQARNVALFAACSGLIYLCAPLLYVGVTQASLCKRLGASDANSNLPATAYFAMTGTPVLVAWFSPYVSALRWNLVLCFVVTAATLGAVAVGLLSPVPAWGKVAMVVLQGAVCGATGTTAIALLWEVVGRGVAESRRGVALSLAFGAGPVLAVLGSLGAQFCLPTPEGRMSSIGLGFPANFALVYGIAAPVMLAAAALSSRLVVPPPERELVREPFGRGVFGGLRDFLGDRVLLTATAVTVLVYTGNTIASNMNLYTEVALGRPPQDYAGYQNALRFGCKVVAGVLLGWLLTRTNPRAGILVTSGLYVAAQLWAIAATGTWYLLAFGLYGAGELVGVYAPNYILSASAPSKIRRNMALTTLMMAPVAPAAYLFGAVSDRLGRLHGPAFGFRASFAICASVMTLGALVALTLLPPRPRAARDGEPPPAADHQL
jgi:MFS family permease